MRYQFTELFDIPALTRLCENFTELTGKVTSLIDLEGKVHISTGWQEICTRFHRANPASAQRCLESDTILANQLSDQRPYKTYQCKNGLINVAVPVYVDGSHVANFYTGQFLFEQPNEELFVKQACEFDFPTEQYLESLRKVPIYSPQEVKATLNFLVELTEVMGEMGSEKLKKLESEEKLRAKLETQLEDKSKKLSLIHKKYQAALSVTKVGVWEWAIDSGSIFWSEESVELWGLTQDTFNNTLEEVRQPIHPDDVEAWQADVNACLEGIKEHDAEFRIFHPDNSIHWIHAKGSIELDEAGKPAKMSGIVVDITERKNIEKALKDSEHNLRQAQKLAHIGSWELELTTDRLSWSDEIFEIFEVDKASFDATYEAFISFIHPDDRELVNSTYLKSVETRKPYEIEHRLLFDDGRIKYVRELGATSYDRSGKPLISRGTVQDITERKLLKLKVEQMAYYDQLTGLPNRSLFNDRFEQAMATSKRNKQYGAVLFVDLDKFKALNDTHGHDAGDSLLKQVGQRMLSLVRATDTVARIGGDEFLALLVDLSENEIDAIKKAKEIGCKIATALSNKYMIAKSDDPLEHATIQHTCSASVGIATFYDHAVDKEEIIKRADQAMYLAKNSDQNSVIVYSEN